MAEGYSSNTRGQVEPTAPVFSANALIATAILIAALYLGREVFVPFVIAVLLAFVLAVPVRLLQSLRLGRVVPVALVVVLAFATLLSIGAVVTSQLTQLAGDLPRYQSTIRTKITDLKGAASGTGPLERMADMLQNLANEVQGPPTTAPDKGDPARQAPIPVEITGTRAGPLQTAVGYLSPLLHPLATVGLVAVFVIFMLLQRGDLRNRLIRLAGSRDLQRTTAAMNDAARRLSRFFLTQVLLNITFGVVVGIGLWAIGIPNPILWGIMASISRFIPYVGVIIAAGGPLILAAAVDPGWSMLLWTAAFFACIEFAVGQMIEPLLYGHSTGLSPLAVIASVTFWTWLWGPVGLILATPLTVCLVVLGRHVEQLEFLEVMFGDRPALTEAESFYQRMLAGDAAEATEQAELFLQSHSLATYYDEVAVKGLALASADLARGALDEVRIARMEETASTLVDNLADHEDEVPEPDAKTLDPVRAAGDEELDRALADADALAAALPVLDRQALAPDWLDDAAVLCIAGRNTLDRIGATMLSQLLVKHGLGSQVEGPEILAAQNIVRLPNQSTRIVCLSYLDTSRSVHVRYAVRRLRRHMPDATILVASWGLAHSEAQLLCESSRSNGCANRLIEAARFCLEAASHASAPPRAAEPLAASAA